MRGIAKIAVIAKIAKIERQGSFGFGSGLGFGLVLILDFGFDFQLPNYQLTQLPNSPWGAT